MTNIMRSRTTQVVSMVVALSLGVGVVLTPQASAFSVGEALSSFWENVTNSTQRMYLRLPGQKSGEAVLKQSAMAGESITSMDVAMTMDAQALNETDTAFASFEMTAGGPVELDENNPTALEQDLSFQIAAQLEGTSLSADFDFKQAEDAFYMRLNQIPAIPQMDLREFKGVWFSFPMTEEMKTGQADDLTPEQEEKIELAIEALIEEAIVSPAVREQKDDFQVFVITIELPDAAMVAFYEDVMEIMAENDPEEYGEYSNSGGFLAEALDRLEPVVVEVWVDTSSLYLRHVEMPLTMTEDSLAELKANYSEDIGPAMQAQLEQLNQLKMSFSFDFGAFNEPVQFEIPAESRPFEDVMVEFFGAQAAAGGVPVEVGGGYGYGYGLDDSLTVEEAEAMIESGNLPAEATNNQPPTAPSELPELTPEEEALLEEYGIELNDLY